LSPKRARRHDADPASPRGPVEGDGPRTVPSPRLAIAPPPAPAPEDKREYQPSCLHEEGNADLERAIAPRDTKPAKLLLPRMLSTGILEGASVPELLLYALCGAHNEFGADPFEAMAVRIADELGAFTDIAANGQDPEGLANLLHHAELRADVLAELLRRKGTGERS
jgi:hypothetical protein